MRNYLNAFALLSFVLILGQPGDAIASSGGSIGKVVLINGEVQQIVGDKVKTLKEGDPILEGGIIKTGPKSSVKIFLEDQSVMSLGPASTLNLDEVGNHKVPNINLVEGQIRTKVMKNMIANAISSHQIKFILRTKTAAMGVRGTDFEVVYNSLNKVTSLVTFEGAVAMVKTDPSQSASASQTANMVPLLVSEKAVVVTEGKFSSVNPVLPQVTQPVKISPAQFESLKRSDPTASTSKSTGTANVAATASKSFVSPIPPGVDPKIFASGSSSIDKQVSAVTGVTPEAMKAQIQNTSGSNSGSNTGANPTSVNGFTVAPAPPPEGQYNNKTGSYAPPAGGFLDLKSGLYIPPPPGSAFDANTGVYNPPAAMGKFDSNSGSYVPPKDFQLDAKQGLVPLPAPVDPTLASAQANSARSPATAAQSGASATQSGASGAGPSIVPGFSALNNGNGGNAGQGPGNPGMGPGGMPMMGIPGMVGGMLPGMSLPGFNNPAGFNPSIPTSGYGIPIANNFPPPPAPSLPGTTGPWVAATVPSVTTGTDPACVNCAAPPSSITTSAPTSTKISFGFTVK